MTEKEFIKEFIKIFKNIEKKLSTEKFKHHIYGFEFIGLTYNRDSISAILVGEDKEISYRALPLDEILEELDYDKRIIETRE